MELVQEFFLTAFIALLFSYLVAKLVSFAMATAGDSNSTSESKDVDNDVIMEELQFGEKLNVGIPESENRVELVEEEPLEKAEKFPEEVEEILDSVSVSRDQGFQLPGKSMEVVGGLCKESSESEKEEVKTEHDSPEETFENKQVEETAEESGDMRESKEILVSEEDDDEWEGIERSELEKVFGAAVKYLGSDDKDNLVSDVQMELYGLHMIATQGPCHDRQPMALMLSARAKWNAWQKLGNMSPEEAMEQYVKLLSDRVPGWMEEHCSGDGKLESREAAKPEAVAPELGSFSVHQTNYTHERNTELKSDSEADDLTGGSCIETMAKD